MIAFPRSQALTAAPTTAAPTAAAAPAFAEYFKILQARLATPDPECAHGHAAIGGHDGHGHEHGAGCVAAASPSAAAARDDTDDASPVRAPHNRDDTTSATATDPSTAGAKSEATGDVDAEGGDSDAGDTDDPHAAEALKTVKAFQLQQEKRVATYSEFEE